MELMMAMAAILVGDDPADPVKEIVLRFLLSYGGIATGVSFLVEGLKGLFKSKVDGKEPIIVIALSFIIGLAAKGLVPDVYGPNTPKAWALHGLILIFVAIGAAAFHDKFLSVLTSFLPKKSSDGAVGSGGSGGAGSSTGGTT